jgi:hypothetical protein
VANLGGEFALAEKIEKARGPEGDALEALRRLRRTGGGKVLY